MSKTVAEIKSLIKVREDDMAGLWQRHDDDWDLLTLEEYVPVAGYESYTSPSPRNLFKKVVDGLNRSVLSISIEQSADATDEETKAASTGEIFLYGALAAVDRRLRNVGEPPVRQSMAHYSALRGWYAQRCLVYVPDGEQDVVFDVQPWDIRHVTWEMGSDGPLWAAYKRVMSAAQIHDEYPNADIGTAKDAVVIDFWDGDENSVIVRDGWGKEPTNHGIGHVPVWIGAVGGTPSMQPGLNASSAGSVDGNLLKFKGDSVWDSSRDQYQPWNTHVSTLMDIAKKGNVGSLVYESVDGKKKIDGDPHETFAIVPLVYGKEKIYPLDSPRAAPETKDLLNIFGAAIEQSGLPDPLSFGGSRAPESGRALAIRIEATRSVFNPYTGLTAEAYSWLTEELLTQFHKKSTKSAVLTGFMPGEGGPDSKGSFFKVTVKPTDINPDWFVDVSVEPRLPRDEETEASIATMLTASQGDGLPLISQFTARGDILHVQDPNSEKDRILSEKGESLPPIIARLMAAALVDRGKPEVAEEVLALLQEGQQAQGQAGAPAIPEDLLRRVIEVLAEAGQGELAENLLRASGVQPQGGQPQQPQQAQQPQQPQPEEGLPEEMVQIIREIAEALAQAGQPQLAQQFLQSIDAGQSPPAEMIDAIINVLIEAGREDLGQALMQLLGVAQAPEQVPAVQGV